MVIAVLLYSILSDRITLDGLAKQESALRQWHTEHPWLVYAAAFCSYAAVTGFSVPGATPMSLMMGWYFGLVRGFIMVSFASTLGATIAFLLSRYLFRDTVQSRFGTYLKTFNDELDRDGAFYLFTLRLIPAVPFFVINIVMGLTRIRTWTFWWVSQTGMLAGTVVYIYAGSTIPSLSQLADPSQLRPHDITSWPEFIARLSDHEDPSSTGRLIYQQLDEPSRNIVDTLHKTATAPNQEQQTTLLRRLNMALTQPNWLPAIPTSGDKEPSDAATSKQTTSTNRATLVAAMPGIISAPQPILSHRLLLAFALLGSFPIIVKKLVSRFSS